MNAKQARHTTEAIVCTFLVGSLLTVWAAATLGAMVWEYNATVDDDARRAQSK